MRDRFKAFSGLRGEERAERAGQWVKALAGDERSQAWCVDRAIGLEKAAAEVPNSAGGFLAPTDFDAALISVKEQFGAFRQGAEVRPSRSDGQVRPRRVGGLTASYVAEGAAIPRSQLLLDAVESSQKKAAILTTFPSELMEDSAVDIGAVVAGEAGYAFAGLEDDAGFNGDGTSTYRGIRGLGVMLAGMKSAVAAGTGHDTFLEIDSTDIAKVMAQVMGSAIPGSAWYVSATAYGQTICRLSAVTGGLVATLRPDGTLQASYLGFPVRISGKLPDVATSLTGLPMLFFGNLAMSSLIVEARQTVVAMSRQYALESDQILFRATQRIDIITHSVGSASVAGPVAMLVGTA